MTKVFRFSWNYHKRKFESPSEFISSSSDGQREKMNKIVAKFLKESGVKPTNSFIIVVAFLAIFIGLMVGAFYLLPKPAGIALLIGGPFLSFVLIVYLMVRKNALEKVSEYLEKNKYSLDMDASLIGFTINCQFVKSIKKLFSGHSQRCKSQRIQLV